MENKELSVKEKMDYLTAQIKINEGVLWSLSNIQTQILMEPHKQLYTDRRHNNKVLYMLSGIITMVSNKQDAKISELEDLNLEKVE